MQHGTDPLQEDSEGAPPWQLETDIDTRPYACQLIAHTVRN